MRQISNLPYLRGRTEHEKYGDVFDLANHPVIGVTYYEAVAFCRWANSRWQMAHSELQLFNPVTREINRKLKIENRKFKIRLPSEAEWERAARAEDGRRYAWNAEIDPERAKYGETGLYATNAVGAFPRGASRDGVLDLSGNVHDEGEYGGISREAYLCTDVRFSCMAFASDESSREAQT